MNETTTPGTNVGELNRAVQNGIAGVLSAIKAGDTRGFAEWCGEVSKAASIGYKVGTAEAEALTAELQHAKAANADAYHRKTLHAAAGDAPAGSIPPDIVDQGVNLIIALLRWLVTKI